MSNPPDDALGNVSKEVEDLFNKSARKQATEKTLTVAYTTPDGEGEAIVEICQDGERHFVQISVDIPYNGRKTLVDVVDDSLGSALVKAEEEFREKGYGSISLEWPDDDEGHPA